MKCNDCLKIKEKLFTIFILFQKMSDKKIPYETENLLSFYCDYAKINIKRGDLYA